MSTVPGPGSSTPSTIVPFGLPCLLVIVKLFDGGGDPVAVWVSVVVPDTFVEVSVAVIVGVPAVVEDVIVTL
jgi:hypothetical protein